jgi:hypothetical protein
MLTKAERDLLDGVQDPAFELDRQLRCELEAGHVGEHAALGQTNGPTDESWWLCWAARAGSRRLVQLDPCPAERSAGGEPWFCELPDQHPGGHSFDLDESAAAGGRAPTPAYAALIEAAGAAAAGRNENPG